MSDELLVEAVEINLDESQIIGTEDGEVHESEEPEDGYRISINVDDGISTPENPGMMICTPAGHPFLIDAEDWPRIRVQVERQQRRKKKQVRLHPHQGEEDLPAPLPP